MVNFITSKRDAGRASWLELFIPPGAVIGALLVGSGAIALAGASPLQAYLILLQGAFGSLDNLAETLVRTSPLLFAGLGISIGIRCGLWNIGAEGQLYLGALIVTWLGITLTGWPSYFLLPLSVVLSFAAGGAWAAIPGLLKARLGGSEIISTIMLNYVAIYGVSYLVSGPLQEAQKVFPQSPPIPVEAHLPIMISGTRLHAGIVLALVSAVAVYILLWKTTLGYEIRAVGHNPEAARYAGIKVGRKVVIAMLLSGGLAGFAGMGEILGLHHRLLAFFSPGYGYTAIAVALLGRLHPLGVVLAAMLFGVLEVSSGAMQRYAGVPVQVVYIIEGLVILFLLAGEYLYRSYSRALAVRIRRA